MLAPVPSVDLARSLRQSTLADDELTRPDIRQRKTDYNVPA